MKNLILASQSPRRIEILKNAHYFFQSFPVYVSEIPDKNLSLDEQIIDIARRKAEACLAQCPQIDQNTLILASDTMVCSDGLAIGKPENADEARHCLMNLSGKIHLVKTALVFIEIQPSRIVSHIETTEVHFRKLSLDEIEAYVASGEPLDRAGSYAIQGGAKNFVDHIQGDFNNVVGLPLNAFEKMLVENKWKIKKEQI